ncbi:RPA-interacting protein [Eufriesea mexicana]|uniref:RPA-interacting protein n=1 Tax=Eufriesea mexicana TaxID=516756 RepID=A0A310SVD7_9HYME|nr:PREDICTED: RIP-like protein [Eufriesea mexicana]OAD62779.1 RPA-interacting protein [Eufriesea mexicana]
MEKMKLSPTIDMKLRNRNSINKLKHSSPKLQEVLRERCRQRMREKRGQLFNKRRFGLEINSKNVQDTLTEIVRKELKNLATTDLDPTLNPFSPIVNEPLDPEEALELENEILNEEEQWILQEYEKMTQEEIELLAMVADQETDEVICPICQISNLIEKENKVSCQSCNFVLNNCINVKEVGYLIRQCVDTHSIGCKESPGFLPIAENNNISLYLICDQCSTWTSII